MDSTSKGLGVMAVVTGIVAACGTGSSPGGGLDAPGGPGSSVGSFGDGGAASSGGTGVLGDAGCATATAKATKAPVYMLFILDGSESMSQNGKWTAATQALEAIFADMQKQADTGVGVGLIVFSDSKDATFGNGPYPQASVDVPINFVGAAQVTLLSSRLSGQPRLATPTGTALKGGYGELASYVPLTPIPPGGQKVLILITDGVPTDGCAQKGTGYTNNACVVEAGQELKLAPPQDVLTFVIGTGVFPSTDLTSFDPSFLGNLALAGGTGAKSCNPNENTTTTDLCYSEVDPTKGSAAQTEQAFEAAIDAIRSQVLSCTFPLDVDSEAGTLDPTKVNVTVDGQTVPQSPTDGWSYNDPSDPTQIVFNGQACTKLKNDPNADVRIVLGCTTISAQ